MLKSLLIGLDGSEDGRSAVELGIVWAKRFDALALGLAVVDEPGIRSSESVLFADGQPWHKRGGAPLYLTRARQHAEGILDQFSRRCKEADVACKSLEDFGTPFVQILMEAQTCDLILLGQQTHFDYGREGEPEETLARVLQDTPRPLVVVPRNSGEGEAVVVAYDGSLQASRALYAFEASGLGVSRTVHVVSVGSDRKEASCHLGRALEFLRLHGIDARAQPVETNAPAHEVILEQVERHQAGLLVMGAYGQPVLREFFLGSTTRSLMKESRVPVFCYH